MKNAWLSFKATGIPAFLALLLVLSSCGGDGGGAPVGDQLLTGIVQYQDKIYGTGGFTGNMPYKAVRFAEVQAVDARSGTVIVTTATDAAGSYSLTIPSAYAANQIYIRVLSSTVTPPISVKDMSAALHAVAGANFYAYRTPTVDLSIPATNPAAGAFNILDVFTSGAQFVQSLSAAYPPALTAYWQTGNSNGTYYCNAGCQLGAGIYILSITNVDTDEYDDDVLWHEYGHFIADKFSRDDSPGGVHYLSSNDLDLRLTWSEGWGDFFPGAVKSWLGATTPALLSTASGMASSVYVDTWGGSASSFDFGNPNPNYVYASNEVAVAKVLHDLRTAWNMQSIWDVLASNNVKTSAVPVNLEVFWDSWNSLGKPDVSAILSLRSIKYSADAFEPGDNTPAVAKKAAINGLPESHTLFGTGDVDYIAFDAAAGTQYTIKTAALRNGADTYISIIAPDKTTLLYNNDNSSGAIYTGTVPGNCDQWGECHENGNDILGSIKSFTAPSQGTYFVKIESSANRPLSAGKYGDYSLMITSP